ncbi:ATP-binding cassette domain-containing protein [Paenibacillus sp. GCM10012307]|uniref:ATP-binding cassette domain-containing protein n=1 Tax=Paenibacillus roseus TaxID=2798579 RepID=A0A934MTB8_9BACL|nr:ATP-binding cassette domain-containing protein [Paenibacillus roseus]MBJ6364074.1 ATP-binding cassette domain-containing protein [Paenibacillus roseus]
MEEVDAVLQKKILFALDHVKVTAAAEQKTRQILYVDKLAVHAGEWIHIVGDNGSGKSTFVKLITDQLGMDCFAEGEVYRSAELEGLFPYVRQNPEVAIVGSTPWEDLLIALEQTGIPAEQVQPEIEAALKMAGLFDRRDQLISTMSGGQKQLVAIAGCLAAHAPLLVLDEAASMLDTASRKLVLEAVREQHRQGMTVIWVTHSMQGREPQDRLVVFDKGQITYDGIVGGQSGHGEKHDEELSPVGEWAVYEHNHRQERDNRPAADGGWSLENVMIKQHAKQGKPILDIPQLHIPAGGLTLIAGRNGAGKTTLLETIAGLAQPSEGTIRLDGEPLWNGRKLNRQVLLKFGVSFQHSESQWFLPQAKDEVLYSLRPYSLASDEQEERAAGAMEAAGLDRDLAPLNPWSLSGGQQRRLAWACLLAAKPAWLLLDEPTAGLDAKGIAYLLDGLSRHLEQGGSAIIVTHDVGLFRALANRILVIEDGRLAGSWVEEESEEAPEAFGAFGQAGSAQMLEPGGQLPAAVQNDSPPGPEQGSGSENEKSKGLRWSQYDPRALWLSYVLLAAGILLQHDWQGLIVSGLITIAALWIGKADLRPWLRLSGFYVIMFIFFSFVSGLSIYPSRFDFGNAGKTLFYFCKLFLVMLLGLGMASAVTPFRLQRALEQAIRPLERFGVPVERISLTISLIFRFIPLLLSEWSKLSRIVQARGKRATAAGKVPAKDLHRVVLPYIMLLLRMAEQMSEALEARGFGKRGMKATRAWTLRLARTDYFLTAGAAALFLLLALL